VAATPGLVATGSARASVLALWLGETIVSGLASLAGYSLFQDASQRTIAFVLAFAGGAILTMLADTMLPEAYEHGGKLTGLLTTIGFTLAFGLQALD
jgi:zinc transporter, ZIP family